MRRIKSHDYCIAFDGFDTKLTQVTPKLPWEIAFFQGSLEVACVYLVSKQSNAKNTNSCGLLMNIILQKTITRNLSILTALDKLRNKTQEANIAQSLRAHRVGTKQKSEKWYMQSGYHEKFSGYCNLVNFQRTQRENYSELKYNSASKILVTCKN